MTIGSKIFRKSKVYNSIDWAKENINTVPDGSVFIAEEHEFTRGRQGRLWSFDKDQLAITILLKPKNLDNISKKDLGLRLIQLNMAITSGILKVLEKFDVKLKWPNDFYYQDGKVGGILSTVVWQDSKILGIIFGFAINVNNSIKDKNLNFKAYSLSEILDQKIDKEDLLKDILVSIDKFYDDWLSLDFDKIFNYWKFQLDYLVNKKISVHKFDGTIINGKFTKVLSNGDLLLALRDNTYKQVSFNIVENILID